MPPIYGGSTELAVLIARLVELGCQITELSAPIVGPDGPVRVRHAVNPANSKFVILPNVPDDERLAPSMIGNIERRLGLDTGFPNSPVVL